MQFLITLFLLALGLGVLKTGSDFIVNSAAKIAKKAGISEFVIGLTIVAVGTSLPELANALTAALHGNTDLALGNIIGANIYNIALILAAAAVYATLVVNKEIYERDVLFMLACSLLAVIVAQDGRIGLFDGIFFLVLFFGYLFFFVTGKIRYWQKFNLLHFVHSTFGLAKMPAVPQKYAFPAEPRAGQTLFGSRAAEEIVFRTTGFFSVLASIVRDESRVARFLLFQGLFFTAGLVLVVFGAELVIDAAVLLPLPEHVTGLVILSLGTTLPELSVALSAMRNSHAQILVGNAIGSVITNTLLVLGVAAIARPIPVSPEILSVFLPFFVFICLLFVFFTRNDYRISRAEGLILLFLCFGFALYTLLSAGT